MKKRTSSIKDPNYGACLIQSPVTRENLLLAVVVFCTDGRKEAPFLHQQHALARKLRNFLMKKVQLRILDTLGFLIDLAEALEKMSIFMLRH